MNQKVRELAIKYNLITEGMVGSFYMDALNKFAEELMAQEREACIEIAKQYALKYSPEMCLIKDVCDAIRARGEVK